MGEDLRLVLISVTEGEDKPLKYPTIFNSADVAIVTKVDLAAAVEFSWETAYDNVQAVRPGMPEFKLSAKTGEGMEEHLKFLAARLIEVRLMELVEIKGVPKKQESCESRASTSSAGYFPSCRNLIGRWF